jgi:hypothetical protein
VKFSRTIAIFVTLLVTGSPLLVCLPNSAMTPAEMECCKKMAGNCDMGGRNHKCCDVTVNHAAPTAAITQSSSQHVFMPCVSSGAEATDVFLPQCAEQIHPSFIRISSSPPVSPTVLRI